MDRHSPLCARPAGPAEAAQEEHLLLLRNATAAGLLLDTCKLYQFALYASLFPLRAWTGGGVGGALSWTEIFLSTPLAANFWPGLEEAAEGCAAGRGHGEFAFYVSRSFFFSLPKFTFSLHQFWV